MKKANNDRKNPGIKGRRPDRKAARVATATANLERWRSLTPAEQVQELDRRLGVGVGARRQRARLALVRIMGRTHRTGQAQTVQVAPTLMGRTYGVTPPGKGVM